MPCSKLILPSLLWTLSASAAWCQVYPAITTLGRNADMIVVAAVDRVIEPGGRGGTPNLTIQLRVETTLKGPAMPALVASTPAMSARGQGPTRFPGATVGESGIWFLKSADGTLGILPRRRSSYRSDELFLPVTGPPIGATLDDQLLAYLVRWYQTLDHSKPSDDELAFYSTFEQWDGKSPAQRQMVAALAPLIASTSPLEHIEGLMAAVQVESWETLPVVLKELPTLRTNPRFAALEFAMHAYPVNRPKDPGWIGPIRQLVAMRTDVPGLDVAAVGALWRIRTKEIWPVMAELLDSKDPSAQLLAARCFSVNAADTGATGATEGFMLGSKASPAELIAFWKEWWSRHRELFPAP